MDGNATLTRRHFIVTAATAAGGLAIGLATGPSAFAAAAAAQPGSNAEGYDPHDIDAFIAIEPDDSVLIRYVRSEMGQGSMTALPMIVTEELQCDWSKVRVEYASPNRNLREDKIYGPMFSHGSQSVRASQKKMQQVGASAREDASDEVKQAIAIAKVVQRPVKLVDARRGHPPGQVPAPRAGRLQGRHRPRRTADRMVDARRDLVDLRLGRHSVPDQ